jgi:hypothetical protein
MRSQWRVVLTLAVAGLLALIYVAPVTAQIHDFEKRLAGSQASLRAAGQSITPTCTFCSECFMLDTYDPNNTPPGDLIAHSTTTLETGVLYLITIKGTYAVWPMSWWVGSGQGAVEAAPQFSSPGGANGPVVADWEWLFGWYAPTPILAFPIGLPFQSVSLDGGLTYGQLVPVGAQAYNPSHVYQYVVKGQNAQVFFKKHDSPTNDNYGVFRICIQKLTVCGSLPAGAVKD